MNRPKITKETLKELRGKLLAEQNAHEDAGNIKDVTEEIKTDLESPMSHESPIVQENEQEMDMDM